MISQKRKVYGHYHGLLMSLWTKFNIQSYLKWRRRWHPTPVLLPGKSHGWKSLVGYSPWGREESDTTEWPHFHFSFSCLGEGNGNPLQCSCLKNPRDGGAWWAVVYGVTQSRTQLRRLSSSSLVKKIPQWDGERRVPLSYGTLIILKGMCMWSSLVYTQIHLHAPKRHRIVTQGTLSTKCVP